jgi:hypothetical protein
VRRLLILAVIAFSVGETPAEIYGSLYRSDRYRVEMLVPKEWTLSEDVAYPGMLAVAVHKTGARLTLSVQSVPHEVASKDYVDRNEKALRKLGYRIGGVATRPGGALVIDAAAPGGKKRVRQAYLLHDQTAYILTLAASTQAMPGFLSAFDYVLSSLVFEPARPADAGPGDAGTETIDAP